MCHARWNTLQKMCSPHFALSETEDLLCICRQSRHAHFLCSWAELGPLLRECFQCTSKGMMAEAIVHLKLTNSDGLFLAEVDAFHLLSRTGWKQQDAQSNTIHMKESFFIKDASVSIGLILVQMHEFRSKTIAHSNKVSVGRVSNINTKAQSPRVSRS